MKCIILITFILYASACHNNVEPVLQKTQVKETPGDTTLGGTSENMIITPDEWKEDSVFADGSIPASWSVAGISDANQLKVFIKILRIWVDSGNKDSIAAHIVYPLSNNKKINSPAAFLDNYNQLFNERVIKSLKAQKLSQIMRNNKGAMIGNGEIWIRNVSKGVTDEFKIVSINN